MTAPVPSSPSLAQIVAALSVTYTDATAAAWLVARHFDLGASPFDLIVHGDTATVADLVRRLDGVDPSDFTITDTKASTE